MNTKNRYIILYIVSLALLLLILYFTNLLEKKNVNYQQDILLKQAQTHFQDQVNNRKWNAQYNGVYVVPKENQKPNPYLKDNIIKTDDGKTLLKINPALMTRELSEISKHNDFHFRITSLKPLNPENKPDEFEKRALTHIEKTSLKEYYELIERDEYRYMGALTTTKECLSCHQEQGYKIGDIRGGISIHLDTDEYYKIVDNIKENITILRAVLIFLLLSITFLIRKQFKYNENLQSKVLKRTKEILTTKTLMQEVIDSDPSFLIVADDRNIIMANKTMLDFFDSDNLSTFKKEYSLISNQFVKQDDETYLTQYIDGEYWISYLHREQNNKNLKVMMLKNGIQRHFRPQSKKVVIENKELHIIIFDEITKDLENINKLKDIASKDQLTNLFNRAKFDDVLHKEIELSKTTQSLFCILFLDIDHFKKVNDTYGHDVGDLVLKELANILKISVRGSDFIARWGGEEFAITLQSSNVNEAALVAEKIRKKVQEHDFGIAKNQTISIGVTKYIENETPEELMKRVDTALYEAKNSGRNKVVVK